MTGLVTELWAASRKPARMVKYAETNDSRDKGVRCVSAAWQLLAPWKRPCLLGLWPQSNTAKAKTPARQAV